MIKLENVVLASPEQMKFIIQGLRNPMNSWEKSDSGYHNQCDECGSIYDFLLGANDKSLMQKLANAGTDHRKFMRMMPVYVRITAPLYWWKEFDTYKIGSVANSCSTMHKIQEKEFTLEDFSTEHLMTNFCYETKINFDSGKKIKYNMSSIDVLNTTIGALNTSRELYLETKDKVYWWQMIQLLPSSYNQTRNVMLNYEVLANIYKSRKDHKLDEWRTFCRWIKTLPYQKLITGEDVTMCDNCMKQYDGCSVDCTNEFEPAENPEFLMKTFNMPKKKKED